MPSNFRPNSLKTKESGPHKVTHFCDGPIRVVIPSYKGKGARLKGGRYKGNHEKDFGDAARASSSTSLALEWGMRVRVLFFGQLKEITGVAQEDAELSDGARVEDLFERYGRRFPKLAEFRGSVAASVNQEYSGWRAPLSAGDEVAFLPPVSGGQGGGQGSGQQSAVAEDIFQLVREPIRPHEIIESLKAPEDGAMVVFDGFVRNNFKGGKTLYLEYEAYEPMAYAKMREIGAEIRAKFSVRRVAIVHRLGRLEIGETSVWIAVSAAHRGAAFDACRYAIDTLKRAVPIWKKEYFAGGAVWAEGEVPSQEAISGPSESSS
jgi:MoaE-MoaD fusion protein